MVKVTINNKNYELDIDPETPLLWVLRDVIGLVGTKYGCGVAQCGACVVHLNGDAVRSCVTKISRAAGQNVVTIEGLSEKNDHPLQKAWMEVDVVQCGYCQAGQIMAAAVLLRENNNPTDDDIDKALEGNICRCGTYLRIKKAIHVAAGIQRKTTVK
jgi:isoquinoline 1-oxidoreductase alpha subunit